MAEERTAVFLADLRRFQRERRRRALASILPIAALASVVMLEGALIAFHPTREVLLVLITAVVIVLAATAAVACKRTASLSETARLVDRSFALKNLAVTALECADRTDTVSQMIVDAALARLDSRPTSGLLSERSPRSYPLTAGIAMLALLLAVPLRRDRDEKSEAFVDSPTTADAMTSSDRPANAARIGTRILPGNSPQSSGPTQSTDKDTISRSVPQRQDSRTSPAGPLGDTPSAPHPSSDSPASTASAPAATAMRTAALPTPSDSRSDRSGAPAIDGRASSRQGRADGPGARAGGGATAGQAQGAGGVNRSEAGADDSHSATARSSRDGQRDDAVAYREGRARSESAIAAERIPPALREYVRDYFLAIKPGIQP